MATYKEEYKARDNLVDELLKDCADVETLHAELEKAQATIERVRQLALTQVMNGDEHFAKLIVDCIGPLKK